MEKFKEELNWTPRQCRDRLHQLIVKMTLSKKEEKEGDAIKNYLRSMGKD